MQISWKIVPTKYTPGPAYRLSNFRLWIIWCMDACCLWPSNFKILTITKLTFQDRRRSILWLFLLWHMYTDWEGGGGFPVYTLYNNYTVLFIWNHLMDESWYVASDMMTIRYFSTFQDRRKSMYYGLIIVSAPCMSALQFVHSHEGNDYYQYKNCH